MRRLVASLVLAAALAAPAAAGAHAQLQSTSPTRGERLDRAPRTVVFRFDEAVEGAFGAVRVYDARGRRVDDGTVTRPGGRQSQLAVGLRGGLGDGAYTATYRAVSADGHPVSGGVVFQVGEGAAAPGRSVGELLAGSSAGTATSVAAGLSRALGYGALAVVLGGLLFLAVVWPPGLASGGAGALEARWRTVWRVAVAVGVLTAVTSLVLQAATAGGTSFWAALDPSALREVLDTRAGRGWLARLLAWLALGLALALVPRRRALLAVLGVALAVTPALSGHASVQPPVALLFPLDVVHVLAMAAWLGGLVALIVVLPAATRALEAPDRTRLLAATLVRFSRVATIAVIALTATGAWQAIIHLERLGDLLDSAFGRAVLVKIALLAAALAFGAFNQRRSVPRLQTLASRGEAPGGAGRLLRSAVRTEVALLAVVLAVTGALVSYAPPSTSAAGPVSRETRLGPYELQLTVDPASPGANAVHLYLLDAGDGSPFDGTKEISARASLPAKGIERVAIDLHKAGPGHYVSDAAPLAPAGDWRLEIRDRVSDFDEYSATVEVPVR